MADTFTTSLSIRQIETGTRSGTWGTETNTQYELLDNAFSYVANDLASDADATLTISDGTASNARYFYIKFTSSVSLTATRTITLAPDDSKKIWIVENATTGSQALTFKQGSSGSTVTVSNGNTAMIYADGAGATNGAITNAFTDLQLAGTTSVAGLDAGSGSITTTGTVTGTTLAGTLSTAAQTNITSVGTLTGFTSTGIDDNADATAITIDSSENVTFTGSGTFGSNVTALTSFNSTTGNDLRLNAGSANRDIFMQVNSSTLMTVQGSTGNVGIGTTSPAAKLHATGTFGTTLTSGVRLDGLGATTNNVAPIAFYNQSSNWGTQHAANIAAGSASGTDGGAYLRFSTSTDGNTAPAERFRITSAGKVGIGTSSPSETLEVNSRAKIGNITLAGDSTNSTLSAGNANFKISTLTHTGGAAALNFEIFLAIIGGIQKVFQVEASGTGDTYTNDGTVSSLSDERVKTDIQDLTDGLEIVKQLRPVTFKYNDTSTNEEGHKLMGGASDKVRYGFIAQEVEAVAPQYVEYSTRKINNEEVNDFRNLSTTRMLPMLFKAVQEQQVLIEQLQAEVALLKG